MVCHSCHATCLHLIASTADVIRPLVADTIPLLHAALVTDHKSVLIEGANAALLDIDFGMGAR